MKDLKSKDQIPLGPVNVLHEVSTCVPPMEVVTAIIRHANRDWGEVTEENWKRNDEALKSGGLLLSVYEASNGQRFWIFTEEDRSATTVLLPGEY